ncbi:ADH-zinc-N domain-containing protein [Fusarium sp. LHS14.1]|nr:ADH-zinc-N domain-containing protein [Fusarium sp. LHS14.1]
MAPEIPSEHRVLILEEAGKPLSLEVRPTPKAGPGSVVVRVLAVSLRANTPRVYQDPQSGHPLPTPFVPGFMAIARVAEIGPDTTHLQPGDLVLFDPYILGRDDPNAKYISGMMQGFNEGSKKLAHGEWRDSTLAEYAKLPLENCHPLDEKRLLGDVKDGGLGYTLDDLTHFFSMLIPFGGLADVDVKAGDTAIIAPATGRYGSAAVHVALAMGARVIAIGRNATVLSQLSSIHPTRLRTVQITGDAEKDTKALSEAAGPGGVDVFWDMSPPGAGKSTHFTSSLNALKEGARVSLLGSVSSGVSFDYMQIMFKALTIKGTWMCTREQTRRLISMAETGVLPLGSRAGMRPVRKFGFEEWKEALNVAAERIEPGEIVVVP